MKGSKATRDFDGQLEGEEALLLFRKHPVVMRKGLIVASVGLLIGPLFVAIASYIKPEYVPSPLGYLMVLLGGCVLSAILFFPSWMSWHFSTYLLTNQRFIQVKQQGFFNRSMVDIGLDTITMVNYEVKGVQETLLGFGTITMQTFVGELVIHEVHHPEKLQREITETLRKLGFLRQSSNPQTEVN